MKNLYMKIFEIFTKNLSKDTLKISFIMSILYGVLFNSAIFAVKFEYYQANIFIGILELIKDFLLTSLTLFVIFLGLSLNRYLFIIGSLFLFITGAPTSYYLYFYRVPPSVSAIACTLCTNETEFFESFGTRLSLWIIFSIIICIYTLWRYMPSKNTTIPTRILSIICLGLMTLNIVWPKYHLFKSYFPMQYLHNTYLFFFVQNGTSVKKDISKAHQFINNSDEDLITVLVIGESARYDHFSINGYHRDTTPRLAEMDDLVSYKAISCSGATHLSVPCMLSRFGEKDLDKVDTETTLISVLDSQNFDTFWVGTQSITAHYRNRPGGSFYDEISFYIIPGGSVLMLPNSLDEKALPYFDKNLQSENKRKFIILHTTGSHWSYANRFSDEFKKFTPVIEKKSKDPTLYPLEDLINTYDNSVLYTDYFLLEVINRLRDKNAIFIYASDHGDSLGEGGKYLHSREDYVPEQREIPFLVWFSDEYKKRHPEKWQAVNELKDETISHDYIFHSILDCVGIESEIIDKSLSLCSKKQSE